MDIVIRIDISKCIATLQLTQKRNKTWSFSFSDVWNTQYKTTPTFIWIDFRTFFLTTVKWIMVSVSLNSFQILILDDQSKSRDFVHFFDMHVVSENIHSFCFFQKITNDRSIIHVRFYILCHWYTQIRVKWCCLFLKVLSTCI